MKLFKYIAVLGLFAAPVQSEEIMTGAQFEAYTHGKIFDFKFAGQAYGSEEYLDDRRVRWAFNGQPCENGYWYEENGAICFLYESRQDPQCWHMILRNGSLVAQFVGESIVDELYEVQQSKGPLNCPGPNVGV